MFPNNPMERLAEEEFKYREQEAEQKRVAVSPPEQHSSWVRSVFGKLNGLLVVLGMRAKQPGGQQSQDDQL